MKSALKWTSQALLLAGLAGSQMGCEAQDCTVTDQQGNTRNATCLKSLEVFTGDPRPGSAVPGDTGTVTVNVRLGDVEVVQSNSTSVNATFTPFVSRAYDTPDSEIRQDFDMLNTTVTGDGTNVIVTVSRADGAPSTLGADVVVELPVNFTGLLDVDATAGNAQVNSVNATNVQLFTDAGDIEASIGAAPLVNLSADVGDIAASISEASEVYMVSGNGDVSADIAGIIDGAVGGNFSTELGDVTLTLPSAATFTLQATADELVDLGTAPAACTPAEAAVNSKTLTCNGGATPLFTASALGITGVVTVAYR